MEIFPEIKCTYNEDTGIVTYHTFLRKNFDGVWYLISIKNSFLKGNNLAEFIKTVYVSAILSKRAPDLIDTDGIMVQVKDKSQITEEERMIKLFR